ncbi:hypothetical protein P5F25_02505 [Clostridium perfringens]|nr:hypothetical protein [Clostridium perfringens]
MILRDITKRIIEVETIKEIEDIMEKYKNTDVEFLVSRVNRFRNGTSYPLHWKIEIIYPVGDYYEKRRGEKYERY